MVKACLAPLTKPSRRLKQARVACHLVELHKVLASQSDQLRVGGMVAGNVFDDGVGTGLGVAIAPSFELGPRGACPRQQHLMAAFQGLHDLGIKSFVVRVFALVAVFAA